MGTADKEFAGLLIAGASCLVEDRTGFWHGRVVSSKMEADRFEVEAEIVSGSEIKYLYDRVLFISMAPPANCGVLAPRGTYVVYPDTPSVRALLERYLRAQHAAIGSADAPWGWGSG